MPTQAEIDAATSAIYKAAPRGYLMRWDEAKTFAAAAIAAAEDVRMAEFAKNFCWTELRSHDAARGMRGKRSAESVRHNAAVETAELRGMDAGIPTDDDGAEHAAAMRPTPNRLAAGALAAAGYPEVAKWLRNDITKS